MTEFPEGRAIVYCEGAFGTTNGKTAHGLVRRSHRYDVVSVVDSRYAGSVANEILGAGASVIPIFESLDAALESANRRRTPATHLVIGLAPDGGKADERIRSTAAQAIRAGLHVDSGLHDFLSEDPELSALAEANGARIRDVRKPPPREQLHFFSGKIDQVDSVTIAILGTDSAVGKRTTAWLLVEALEALGHRAELVGTGQTAWLQGARYGVVFDALVNDFVTGEIEHAVWNCWKETRADVIVLEGQGGLLNPAYPGGLELIAAGRPDLIVLQHAPARRHYDGFPDFPIHPLDHQIEAVEVVSGKPVVAVAVNHENLSEDDTRRVLRQIHHATGRPAVDTLMDGGLELARVVESFLET